MKRLKHYQGTAMEALAELVAGDVSFTVLAKILGYDCDHIFTDGESAIVCHSNPPYPVWAWCKDADDIYSVQAIGSAIRKFLPLESYNVNIAGDVFEKLRKIDPYFENAQCKMELLSYRLDEFIDAGYAVDGKAELADIKDIDFLSKVWQDMAMEMEGFRFSIEECRERVEGMIKDKALYLWRNGEGKIVATTSKGQIGEFGKVAGVYTLPEYRRRGYAINLVSKVTRLILAEGLIPTLYTDGGYTASNECYKKIGYVQVGRLLTIKK